MAADPDPQYKQAVDENSEQGRLLLRDHFSSQQKTLLQRHRCGAFSSARRFHLCFSI